MACGYLARDVHPLTGDLIEWQTPDGRQAVGLYGVDPIYSEQSIEQMAGASSVVADRVAS